MKLQEVHMGMSRHYERKWRHHDGYWLDSYAASQRVYAASLYDKRNAAILAAIPDKVSAVLDIGCGVGDLMRLLSEKSKAVFGVDLTEVNVRQASKNLLRSGVESATVLQAPAEALPFQAGRFDVVVMADVIEHIPDRSSALAEVRRVLRPGGTFICVTPHRRCMGIISAVDRSLQFPIRASRAVRNAVRPVQCRGNSSGQETQAISKVYEEFLSSPELRLELQRAGFTVKSYRRVCFYPGPEGGGVFATLMSFVRKTLGEKRFAATARALLRLFGRIEQLQLLNQKQMWIVTK